jgi:hypothetical protein
LRVIQNILTLAFLGLSFCVNAQNLALHKKYQLSAGPDYPFGAPETDKTSLTDGIFTTGYYFWSQKTTDGWLQHVITITIDLDSVHPIGAVNFNSVRFDKQNVNFPANIYVFLSDDNSSFKYIGDAADTTLNRPGDYLVHDFSLDNINLMARYVRLIAVPKGMSLYCDEIQVMKGAPNANTLGSDLIDKDSIESTVDSLKRVEFLRHNVTRLLGNLKGQDNRTTAQQVSNKLEKKNLSSAELQNLKGLVATEYIKKFSLSNPSIPFVISKYNCFDTLSEIYTPQLTSTPSYKFNIPLNGVQYGSFIVTNTSGKIEDFKIKVPKLFSGAVGFSLFQVPFVPTEDSKVVADPLMPITNAFSVEPGQTQMIFFKLEGQHTGSDHINILLTSQNLTKSISISTTVSDVGLNKKPLLNSIVWAYFYYPMIRDRIVNANADIVAHQVNTNAVPPNAIPRLGSSNHRDFLAYISKMKGEQNILLFMNYASDQYRNGYTGGQFMSPDWQAKFKLWYNAVIKDLTDSGFSKENVYLYPYDEVSGKNISDFKSLILWVRQAIPGIKFYSTMANDEAVNTILPLLDVAQIQATYKGLNNLPPHSAEVWTYSGSAPARDLSPNGFYRLMAWEAFAKGFKGIGFWDYSAEGNYDRLTTPSDPLIYPTGSFSVIYDGPGQQVISTRRWEAFRLGIEDYDLLSLYSAKFGRDKANQFANDVLASPDNTTKADDARNTMITQLGSR